jgi:cephalosporin-C deacetylase
MGYTPTGRRFVSVASMRPRIAGKHIGRSDKAAEPDWSEQVEATVRLLVYCGFLCWRRHRLARGQACIRTPHDARERARLLLRNESERGCVLVSCLCLHGLVSAAVPDVIITPDSPSGIYRVGERAGWTVVVRGSEGTTDGDIHYEIGTQNAVVTSRGNVALVNGTARISGTKSIPGTLLLRVQGRASDSNQQWEQSCGAVFSPDDIVPSMPPPADFNEFWQRKIERLRRTPAEPVLTSIASGNPSIQYSTVEIRARDGINVRGQYASPSRGSSFPAILVLNGAGVFGLSRQWVLDYARRGWLVFNISAHDIPVDADEAFYQRLRETRLADYAGSGSENRDANYFLNVILRCHRAIDFLQSRPEWNRETLIASGRSQGGWLAFAVAALHPAITAFHANVPAGCDHTAETIGRPAPWPHWTSRWTKNRAGLIQASRYFDAANFASFIRVPGLVGIALADTTCPADGIFAAVNQLKAPKEIIVMPGATHGGDHARFEQALQKALEKVESRSKATP